MYRYLSLNHFTVGFGGSLQITGDNQLFKLLCDINERLYIKGRIEQFLKDYKMAQLARCERKTK